MNHLFVFDERGIVTTSAWSAEIHGYTGGSSNIPVVDPWLERPDDGVDAAVHKIVCCAHGWRRRT